MSNFQRIFNTNCSLPTTSYHWVTSANSRGTIDILWSSLTALILCTWTIQHLNVPPQRKEETWRDKIGKILETVAVKVSCMILTLVAPEMLIGKSLVDWISAHVSRKEMQEFAELDKVEWTVTHGFYANMGGFVIRFSPDTPIPPSSDFNQKETNSTVDEISENSRTPNYSEEIDHIFDMTSRGPQLDDLEKTVHYTPPRACTRTHKDDSSYQCPCRTFKQGKSNGPFEYMHLDDILAHAPFYNGCLLVLPMLANISRPWLSSKVYSPTFTTNKDIVSQALFDFAKSEEANSSAVVRQYIFDMRLYQLARLSGKAWALDAKQLLLAREMGIVSQVPNVSQEAIDNESKGDIIVKALAVFQIVYLVIQLVMRGVENLDSSQLEIVVVAFGTCAMITYALCFSKPKDVEVPRYIEAARFPTPNEMLRIAQAARLDYFFWLPGGTYTVANFTMPYCGQRTPFDAFMLGTLTGGVVFGSIHCATWNFFFPTPTERLLWRISSVAVSVMPLAFLIVFLPDVKIPWFQTMKEKFRKVWVSKPRSGFWHFLSLGEVQLYFNRGFQAFYVLARLFLIVEAFRSLFYLPPGAFQTTTWFTSLPYIE